ncbi:MAG TPA: hypothetical protein VFJ62_18315, partial [Usitatibacter sp.]|nr:hypothetical protein [Usitatibacter sp.]
TSDPWKKYEYACALMGMGRLLPAEPMLRQSLAHYEQAGEPLPLAIVQMQYAVLVDSPGFSVSPHFHDKRTAMGGRAALPQKARALNEAARSGLLEVASSAQASAPERTQALLFLIQAHARLGDFREACATIDRAAEAYAQAGNAPYKYAIYRFKTVPEFLEDRRDMLECRQDAPEPRHGNARQP